MIQSILSKLKKAPTLLLCVLITHFSACSRSDRAITDQAQSLINQRKYSEAIAFIEKELPEHSSDGLNTQLAYAYLGSSGIELLEIAKHINFLKSFKSVDINPEAMSTSCPNPFSNQAEASEKAFCFPLYKIIGFPSPDNKNLLKATAILEATYPDAEKTNQDINLLMAIIYLGSAIQNYDLLVTPPKYLLDSLHTNDRITQVEAASYTLKYFKHTVTDFFLGVHRFYFSYGKIKRFLAKFESKPLLTIGHHTYYGSSRVSAEDFFQFLVESIQDEAKNQIGTQTHEREMIESISLGLSRAVSYLRFQVESGNENFLEKYYLHFLGIGVHLVPSRFSSWLNSSNTDIKLHFAQNPLPKAAQDLIRSVRDSWKNENANALYNEILLLSDERNLAIQLSLDWDRFWLQLSIGSQSELKSKAENFKNKIPLVELHPDAKPDFTELKYWYQNVIKELREFSTELNHVDPNNPQVRSFPLLINQTEDWINRNLW